MEKLLKQFLLSISGNDIMKTNNDDYGCIERFINSDRCKELKLLPMQNVSNSALPTLKDFAVNSFKGIEIQTNRLNSGNASHQAMTIRGSAKRAAEFIEKHY